ncbi:MAG TPA: helix-turn-helix domain-containing protein [Oligoflexia bacterium]|nr:helix-turn-helix domain-containing protein [Oligoflexia bacterium]HMP48547.1 helix-turn-helix domain-containing protein [Oligoflexia bacterium]
MQTITLRDARENSNLSLRNAASSIGVTHPYLSALELGHKPLNQEIAKKLANLYGLSVESLVQPIPQDKGNFIIWMRELIKWWDSRFLMPKVPAVASLAKDIWVAPELVKEDGTRLKWEAFLKEFIEDPANRAVLLSGPMGSGKSFFLRTLALETENLSNVSPSRSGFVPILVSLENFQLNPASLSTSLASYFINIGFKGSQQQLGIFFDQCISRGNALLLFDGLNEINCNYKRAETLAYLQRIYESSVRLTGSKLIITGQPEAFYSRDRHYNGFVTWLMDSWSMRQMIEGCQRWPWEVASDADEFWLMVQSNDVLFKLAKWPLLFHLLTTLYSAFGIRPFQEVSGLCDACCEILERSWSERRITYYETTLTRAERYGEFSWLSKRQFLVHLASWYLKQENYHLNKVPAFSRGDLQAVWEDFLKSKGVDIENLENAGLLALLESKTSIGPLYLRRSFDHRSRSVKVIEEFVFLDDIFGIFYFAKALIGDLGSIKNILLERFRLPVWHDIVPICIQELGRSDRKYEEQLGREIVLDLLKVDDALGFDLTERITHFNLFSATRAIASYNFEEFWDNIIVPFINCCLNSSFETELRESFHILGEYCGSPSLREFFLQAYTKIQRGDVDSLPIEKKWRLVSSLAKLGMRSDFLVDEIANGISLFRTDVRLITSKERLSMRRLFWSIRQVGRIFSLDDDSRRSDSRSADISRVRNSINEFANLILNDFENSVRSQSVDSTHLWDVLTTLVVTQESLFYFKDMQGIVQKTSKIVNECFDDIYFDYPHLQHFHQFLKVAFTHPHLIPIELRESLIGRFDMLLQTVPEDRSEVKVLASLLGRKHSSLPDSDREVDFYTQILPLNEKYSLKACCNYIFNLGESDKFDLITFGNRLSIIYNFYLDIPRLLSQDQYYHLMECFRKLLKLEAERTLDKEHERYYTRPFSMYGAPMYDHIFNVLRRLSMLAPVSMKKDLPL